MIYIFLISKKIHFSFFFWKFKILIFHFFSKIFSNFKIFRNKNLHDEKIFFIQIFFNDLDYASIVPENHLEHSTTRSEGDTGRVRGSFFVIFRDFSWFSRFFINFDQKVTLSSWARPVGRQKFHFHNLRVVASPRLLGVGWATGA